MVKPFPISYLCNNRSELNMAQSLLGIPQDYSNFELDLLVHQRRKRVIRPQRQIVTAILDACRTPCVQHWIMVKARLGYDTFWKHMNELVSLGMMETQSDGNKTVYSINEKGLNLLQTLQEQSEYSSR